MVLTFDLLSLDKSVEKMLGPFEKSFDIVKGIEKVTSLSEGCLFELDYTFFQNPFVFHYFQKR